mmetsp:Transcript_25766/g.47090  ORF Transcript_25766/g.47090 Transcript_25766/m.47090 type:complete len:412 (-) Transcript_25766:145-1380(-)
MISHPSSSSLAHCIGKTRRPMLCCTSAAADACPQSLEDGWEIIVASAVWINGPRKQKVAVVAFYYPGVNAPCDDLCGCPWFGNFYGNSMTLRGRRFACAEGAFQALKFWSDAEKFTDKSGKEAFQLKMELEASGTADFTYAGYGSNWKGMMAVQRAKFQDEDMRACLTATGDKFVLEHNSVCGRDHVWSNNQNGSGRNWLGMLLMLLRDELSGSSQRQGTWTDFIQSECQVDLETGEPGSRGGAEAWQKLVKEATDAVHQALGTQAELPKQRHETGQPVSYLEGDEHSSSAPHPAVASSEESKRRQYRVCCRHGCNRPTYNGRAGEYCSRTCRDLPGPSLVEKAFKGMSGAFKAAGLCATLLPEEVAPVCKRTGCTLPTYNGQPGFYCSRKCKQMDACPGRRSSAQAAQSA